MGLNIRYGPMDWDYKTQMYDFGSAMVTNFQGANTFGRTWYVCGTTGNDGQNNGLTPNKAFKTIQKAIDTQGAYRSAKVGNWNWGGRIIVMPGTYAETLTGTLTQVELMGAMPHAPNAVEIKPTTGSAFRGSLNKSAIRFMSLRRSSGTNTTYASLSMPTMVDSLVQNCIIVGGDGDVATSTGIRIGTEATAVTYENMARSRITGCTFAHRGNSTYALHFGIVFGLTNSTSQQATRQFIYSSIDNNTIHALTTGIQLNAGKANGSGGVIKYNIVGSGFDSGNCESYGIASTDAAGADQLVKVIGNYVSGSDAIYNFTSGNVQGNIGTAGAGGTPTGETGFAA